MIAVLSEYVLLMLLLNDSKPLEAFDDLFSSQDVTDFQDMTNKNQSLGHFDQTNDAPPKSGMFP